MYENAIEDRTYLQVDYEKRKPRAAAKKPGGKKDPKTARRSKPRK
jgi:hypothetical protein